MTTLAGGLRRRDTAGPVMERTTSRWRSTAAAGGRGAADRIQLSHARTRTTLRLALAFIATAALTGAIGTDRWLPIHLFLAGGVMLAISGVSLMSTVTWSAAPAPPDRWVAVQRWLEASAAVGVAGVCAATAQPAAVTAVAIAAWVFDSAWRAAPVGATRAARPTEEPT
jgi:hypothetical protein